MSLKGTAMTDKVLRGKINDIHQIEDVNALYAKAEELIGSANNVIEADKVITAAEEAKQNANTAAENAEDAAALAQEAANSVNTAKDNANAAAANALTQASNAEQATKNANDAVASILQAKENGEFDGAPGKDGKDGKDGIDGKNGKDADYSLVANAIKGKASGEVVALTDVSPLEHEMKVKVSQGGATVMKYGLNVFDSESRFKQIGFQKQEDGSWLANNFNGTVFTPPVGTKQMFFRVTAKSTMAHHVSPFNLRVYYKDEPTKAYEMFYLVNTQTDWIELSGFSDASRTIDRITFSYGSSTATRESYYIKDVIFSYADGEYEPYVAPTTYTAVGEAVEGIIGNGESMTLIPDTAGVTIEAEYNVDTKKYIDNKFAELQALILEV